MRSPRPSLRLFVAVYPPLDLVQRLLASVPTSRLPEHRLVPDRQVHLTLQFIGDCPVSDLESTTESVLRSVAGLSAFDLTLQRLVSLPERGPARLVAAETDAAPTLLEIKQRLVTRLAREPRGDRRKFRPHLTLLRFRRPSRAGRLDEPLALDDPVFTVHRVVLMKSTLRSEGALHELVAEASMPAA